MYEANGKKYARVSDILKPLYDFSQIPSFVLEKKTNIGTAVHAAIAADINEEFPIVSREEMGYFESYLKWKDGFKPRVVQSEKRYFCDKTMITGQIDALVLMPFHEIPTLIDFKTSAKESKEMWTLQAHFYAYLLSQNDVSHYPRYQFIKLNKEGKLPDVFLYTSSKETHEKCLSLIEKFWENEKK